MDDNRGTIIVVDDDVGVLRRVERLLRFEGYGDVILCERADDAWPALESARPLAMILDLMMPGVDGYAMLERMRAERPDVPVILRSRVTMCSKYRNDAPSSDSRLSRSALLSSSSRPIIAACSRLATRRAVSADLGT